MQENKHQESVAVDPRHVAFIRHQNNCPLCNEQLSIHVESVVETHFLLREEAYCDRCRVLARVKDHTLQ